MTDWSDDEIMKLMGNPVNPDGVKREENVKKLDESYINTVIDWRAKGAVTSVKDQGHCGSCWTFATCGAMESAHFQATGELIDLAESQFVDCDTKANAGCHGGDVQVAYVYAETNPVELLTSYPYVAKDMPCKYNRSQGKVKVTSWYNVEVNSSSQLKAALNIGPAHVSIRASEPVFHQYTGGIITSSTCGYVHNHAILAVGYGQTFGIQYYIVKNSWSSSWGEDGYVRLGIEPGVGVCGIQTNPSQPKTD